MIRQRLVAPLICFMVCACSVELEDSKSNKFAPTSENSEAVNNGKKQYVVKIEASELASYQGNTCFVSVASMDQRDPNKMVFEKLEQVQKRIGAPGEAFELKVNAFPGTAIEISIKGKEYKDRSAMSLNDMRQDAEAGCHWSRAEFNAGENSEVTITKLIFAPKAVDAMSPTLERQDPGPVSALGHRESATVPAEAREGLAGVGRAQLNDLAGTWIMKNSCRAINSGVSDKVRLVFEGNQFTQYVTVYYTDASCQKPSVDYVVRGQIALSSDQSGFDMKLESLTQANYDADLISRASASGSCGVSNWSTGVPVEILGKDCASGFGKNRPVGFVQKALVTEIGPLGTTIFKFSSEPLSGRGIVVYELSRSEQP